MENGESEKIIIEIPKPPITSLIFEGGGVKGIAYVGAFKTLKEKGGLLDHLYWVAGSSAGAMTALMVALNYAPDEIERELTEIDFSKFAQSPPDGKLAIINYIFKNSKKISDNINRGINDGKKLYAWIQKIVEKKLLFRKATFSNLKNKCYQSDKKDAQSLSYYKNLFVIVTNVKSRKIEVFSWETTPNMQIADAVLASMSIPGFFYIRYIDDRKHKIDWNPTYEKINNHQIIPYVDGGVLNNYPINLFRQYKYWPHEYYGLAESHEFNPSSLGLRVDSKEDVNEFIALKQEHMMTRESLSLPDLKKENLPKTRKVEKSLSSVSPKIPLLTIVNRFLNLLTSDLNKVEQYCQVTIKINDCNIKTTNFDLTDEEKEKLKESGKKAVNSFYAESMKNNIYKKMVYKNLSELEDDYEKIKILTNTLNSLNHKDRYFLNYTLPSLEFKKRLLKRKISELGVEASPNSSPVAVDFAEASGSGYSTFFLPKPIQTPPYDESQLSLSVDESERNDHNNVKKTPRSAVRRFCFCM